MLTALFGIEDGSLSLAVNLLVLVLVVIWLALVYWTFADARRRIGDPVLVATATAASLFPFIGTVVYTILRPPEFLEDARERELETRAAELRLRRLTETSCPRCEHPIELSWLRCPECQQRLKDPCRSCGRPVDPRWSICPHCETAIAARSGSKSPRGGKKPARSGAPPQRSDRPEPKRRPPSQRQSSERQSSERPASASGERQQRPPQAKRRTSAAQGSSSTGSSGSTAPKPAPADQGPPDADGRERPRRKPTSRT